MSEEAQNCLAFDIPKVQMYNMIKWSQSCHEIISYYHLLLLLHCIIVI